MGSTAADAEAAGEGGGNGAAAAAAKAFFSSMKAKMQSGQAGSTGNSAGDHTTSCLKLLHCLLMIVDVFWWLLQRLLSQA